METQQIFEILAKLNAKIDANQTKMDENQERMAINLKEVEADRKRDREDLKRMMAEMNTKMDGNQAEIRSTVCAMRSELKEPIQHEMKGIIHPIPTELDETAACTRATENELNPGMMQSIDEHQEILKEEAAVMLVGEPRKRCRVCSLAAEHHQKWKEMTWGKMDPGGSRLPPAGRCPTMRKWYGKKGQENWDPGKLDRERSSHLPE
jgi:hypothetical protein